MFEICVDIEMFNKYLPGRVTNSFTVPDKEQGQPCLVIIRAVNEQLLQGGSRPRLVKFSRREHAPCQSTVLRLATPEYYRKYEDGSAGVGDSLEGVQQFDMSRLIYEHISKAGMTGRKEDIQARTNIVSQYEPWLFCTSVYPDSERELKALRKAFLSSCGDERGAYDAATEISDADAFACQLGRDFAMYFDSDEYMQPPDGPTRILWDLVKHQVIQAFPEIEESQSFLNSALNVFVVSHGPVMYGDAPIPEYSPEKLDATIFRYFSKRSVFSKQAEYRFAIDMPGRRPIKEVCSLPFSDEIRRLTREHKQSTNFI